MDTSIKDINNIDLLKAMLHQEIPDKKLQAAIAAQYKNLVRRRKKQTRNDREQATTARKKKRSGEGSK